MNIVFFSLNIYLFIATLMTVYFIAYAYINRGTLISKYITVLAIAMLICLFGYLGELNANYLETMIIMNHIQYLAIPVLPVLWILTAIAFTKNEALKPKIILLLCIIPFITTILEFTHIWQNWYYTSLEAVAGPYYTYLSLGKGFWYYVQMAFNVAAIAYTIWIYLRYLKDCVPGAKSVARRLVLTATFPIFGMIFSVLPFNESGISFVPLFMPLSIIVFATIISNRFLMTIKPIAKEVFYDQGNQGIMVFDHNNVLVDANPYTYRYFPTLKAYLNHSLDEIMTVFPGIEAIRGQEHNDSFFFMDRYYQTHLTRMMDAMNRYIGSIFTFIDVTENHKAMEVLKANQAHIEFLSFHDQLTGLYNRHYLEIFVSNLSKDDYPMGLIYIDLNDLKSTNDSKGHLAGDDLIRKTAEIIKETFDEPNVTVRLGGDEFLIFMPKTSEMLVRAAMNRLNKNCVEADISIALGHTIKTQNATFDDAYRQSEDRMYIDKESKKNSR